MKKKIIGILTVVLFIGACVLPVIYGEESDYYLLQKNVDYKLDGLGINTQDIIQFKTNKNTNLDNSVRANHTVLAEYGTATWCPPCIKAHSALKSLYEEGQNFYYVSLVTDKNGYSYNRGVEYNVFGIPAIWWDGGYKINVGAVSVSSAKSAYQTSIDASSTREVKDVDIAVSSIWFGKDNIKINVYVTNNELSTYNGTIRVYITEKVSSMGWRDYGGELYTFPFLNWAFNEAISIPAGGSWNDSVTWVSSSHGYSTVTGNNTMIIGAVSNDEKHKGYSDPPNGHPFDAYYIDEVVAIETVINNPPNKPIITGQTSGKINIVYTYNISTINSDDDQVYYYISWGDGNKSGWLGPYQSGQQASANHTWSEKGDYTIKVKAKDFYGDESDWATLEVNVTKSKVKNIPLFLQRFFERFSFFEKILKQFEVGKNE